MTGFARADGTHERARWHWELKSVNGKSLDIRCRLPAGFEGLEQSIREIVARHIRRGNCQIVLQIQRDAAVSDLRINEAALEQVMRAVDVVRKRCAAAPPTADGILAIKGVLDVSDPVEWSVDPEIRESMLASLAGALDDLAASRRAEGDRLTAIIKVQIDEIARLVTEAAKAAARRPEAIRARLAEQVGKLVEASPALDADRLHQEAVLLAARIDVQEELDRLGAHVAAANDLLRSEQPAGRKLDFLTQEFIREANTLCSKASDPTLTGIGLALKAVIDQMREQVQNVE